MTQLILAIDATTTGKRPVVPVRDTRRVTMRSIQASVEGVGAVNAVVKVYGCNDARFPIEVMTITLSGTNTATDASADSFPWEHYIADVVSVSAGACVSVVASV